MVFLRDGGDKEHTFYDNIQDDSFVRGPKLLSIKYYVIEIMT
jgi:hypothetical protein